MRPASTPRLFKVTPARMNLWRDCPAAYRHKYIDKTRSEAPPQTHFHVGNVPHLALAQWWDLPLDKQVHPAAARVLVGQNWGSPEGMFRDAEHEAGWRAQITRWVADYIDTLHDTPRPVGIERTVAAVVNGMALEGRADRIDLRENPDRRSLVVVDYKTGRNPPTVEDAGGSLALAVYAYATTMMLHRSTGAVVDRAELHHLPTGQVIPVEYDKARIMRQIDRLRGDVDEIEGHMAAVGELRAAGGDDADVSGLLDAAFPATPTKKLCGSCGFRRLCPTGREAVPEAEPWAFLPDLADTATSA